MKTKLKYIGIFIFVSAIVAGGCVFIFRFRLIKHFAPAVKQIGDINIVVKNDTSYITAILVIQNKSFLEIEIDSIDYKIALFEKTYIQNKKNLGIHLSAYGNDTIDFSLKIPFVEIIKDLKVERKRGDSASYSIIISLQYATAFGKGKIPINRAAKLKIPQPPELKVIDIQWKKVRLRSIRAIAKIKIINYSPVALTIKEISYSMNVLNQGTLKGHYKNPIRIKPKATSYIDLPLEIEVTNLGKTLFQVLVNRDHYDYALTLNAAMESSGLVKESFQMNLIKNGKMELRK